MSRKFLTPLNVNSNKVINLADPTAAQDAVSLAYLQSNGQYKTILTVGSAKADYITDGTADDVQIQQAIDAASAAGGGTVFLKKGTYNTTALIELKSNVELLGETKGATIIKGAASDYSLVKTTLSGTTKTVYESIALRNLSFESQYGSCVAIFNTNGVTIRDCEFYFTVTTPVRQGIFLTHCKNVNIDGNYGHDLTGNGISVTATDNFAISNNIVISGANGDDCIDVDFDFLDTSAIASNYGAVMNNICRTGGAGTGIRVENSFYVSVTGNTVEDISNGVGTIGGILINTSSTNNGGYISVSGNNVSNCASGGIVTDGTNLTNVTVTNNVVYNCGQTGGVNVRGGIILASTGVLCTGNIVDGTARTGADTGGILVYKKDAHLISENIVKNCSTGIRLWNADTLQSYTSVVIVNNRLSGNTTDYVVAAATTATTLVTSASGKVGIATTAPDDALHIAYSDASNPVTMKVQNTDSGGGGDAEVFLGTSSTLTNTSVGASLYAERTNTGSAGSTSLHLKTSNGSTLAIRVTIAHDGVATFTADVIVPDEAYGSGWNGSLEVPTKNAVYDKVETLQTIAPRITSTASSATPTPNADTTDQYILTALAAGATFGAPTGTPADGQSLVIRIKDNGTARTLAWNAIYRAIGVTLPTTTVINKTLYVGFKYNSADSKWDALATAQEA